MLLRPGPRAHDGLPRSRDAARLVLACLAAPSLLAVAVLPGAQASTNAREGGIFRVSFQGSSSLQAFDHVDPALAYTRESWALLDTVCARLMRYRDRPPPAGYRIVPEVAAAPSRRSRPTARRPRSGCEAASASATAARSGPTPSPRRSTARWHPASTPPPTVYTQAIVGAEDVRAAGRRRQPASSRAATRSPSASPARCATSPPGRRCRSSAPSRRRSRPARRACARSPAPAPTPSSEYRPDERIMPPPKPLLRRRPRPPRRRLRRRPQRRLTARKSSTESKRGKADWGYAPPQIHLRARPRLDRASTASTTRDSGSSPG